MRILPVAVSLLILLGAEQAFAQSSSNEQALKAVCLAQAKAYYGRDYDRWQQLWLHDPQTTRTVVGSGGAQTLTGWAAISAMMEKGIKSAPPISDVTIENFIARESGNVAWIEYDQILTIAGAPADFRPKSSEKRLLVKSGDQWKVATQVTIGDMSPEPQLNGLGYQLLSAKKVEDAIEVFKLNVRLHPESWNVYDSLGEAYAVAGQKELAIQNYEKSLKLNPKNDSGREALEKLKAK